MIIETTRFGKLTVVQEDIISFPLGLLGFENFKNFFIVDSNDETCIMWLQSTDLAQLAFPVIEPELFITNYRVRLSKSELESIKLTSLKDAKVFTILTIPENIVDMTANVKAPIVINMEKKTGRQCVLQDNEYHVRHAMFKELKSRITSQPTQPEITKSSEPKVVSNAQVTSVIVPGSKTEIQL